MIKKIKRKLKMMNNRGSSLVLVIVSTTFLSVLVSALLMGMLLAYRLKFYKLNSLNNFYAVEQAMDEIYAGIGATVNEHLYNAYTTTAELVVTYDTNKQQYMNLDNDQANDLFKRLFIQGMVRDANYDGIDRIIMTLEGYITDPNVSLLCNNMQVIYTDSAGHSISYECIVDDDGTVSYNTYPDIAFNEDDIVSITFKNLGVKRTITISAADKEVMAQGTYTQSITTDLVLEQPEYNVSFDMSSATGNSLYNYAILADMGLQVDETTSGTDVTVKGNIYTASDYYNKDYNRQTNTKVTDKYNDLTTRWGSVNESAYSGIYVEGDNSNLTLNSDIIICPGSITAFDGASIAMSGRSTLLSEVWADSIVIGGTEGGNIKAAANAYIYDDTELNAEKSNLTFSSGRYFGYSYTSDDVRSINLLKTAGRLATGYSLRSHFSDSAVIVNGKDSTLDMSRLDTLYIAGKSYIEFSKLANPHVEEDGQQMDFDYINVEDYSTGQSLDVKSNQLIFLTQWEVLNENTDGTVSLRFPRTFAADAVITELYDDFLTTLSSGEYMISAVPQVVSGHTYYYLYIDSADPDPDGDGRSKAEEFAEKYYDLFAGGYGDEILSKLYNVANYEEFEVNLLLPSNADGSVDDSRINTAGALTYQNRDDSLFYRASTDTIARVDVELTNASHSKTFALLLGNGSVSENNNVFNDLMASSSELAINGTASSEQQISNFITYMYINMRDHLSVLNKTDDADNEISAWELANYTLADGKYIYNQINSADGSIDRYSYNYSITPLNHYVNYDIIFNGDASEGIGFVNISKTYTDPNGVESLLIVQRGDVQIAPTAADGSARGIIICGGNVTFRSDVTSFTGMIITGAKVMCDHDISLSADANYIANLLAACAGSADTDINLITRKILLQYEGEAVGAGASVTSASISDISYQDILLFENWKKNVE